MFACLYIPNFAAEALIRSDATLLRERPLAVMDGLPPLVHVVAINECARQAGIALGMTKLQAAALDSLQMRQRSRAQEVATHRALLDCAFAFSPKVEDTADDTVLLEIDGLERVFGPPAKLAQALAKRATSLGVKCTVAVAANLEAAMHAARGFAGVTVIAAGEEAQRLGELPIHVLLREPLAVGLWPLAETVIKNSKCKIQNSGELQGTFDRWGVRTFGALALLPPVAVAERLGQVGVTLQKLARGEGLRALNVAEPPLTFEEALELEYPVETLEPLAFLLNRMLEQLCARLEARALATNELRLTLELEDNADKVIDSPQRREDTEKTIQNSKFKIQNSPARKNHNSEIANHKSDDRFRASAVQQFRTSLQLPVPVRDSKIFLKLLQLELAAHPPSAPVIKISLRAEAARPQQAQHGLFTPIEPQPERLELMLARIAGIVGRERVGSAELQDSYRQDAFCMVRFSLPRHESAKRIQNSKFKSQNSLANSAFGRRVFRPPREAKVELRGGIPRHVMCSGEHGPRGPVTWAAGPWRSSGEWWNHRNDPNAAWQREEWDVEIAGGVYRLVQSEKEEWSVDGTYD